MDSTSSEDSGPSGILLPSLHPADFFSHLPVTRPLPSPEKAQQMQSFLPRPERDGAVFKIHVLNAQANALYQAQAGAVHE